MGDKFYAYTDALHALEAHSRHYAPSPRPGEDKNFLPYVGNGHVGVEIAPAAAGSNLYIFGRRHLNVKVGMILSCTFYTSVQSGAKKFPLSYVMELMLGCTLCILCVLNVLLKVPFRPSVVVTPADFSTSVTSAAESAAIVHYTSGLVHSVDCFNDRSGSNRDGRLSISSVHYAHRLIQNFNNNCSIKVKRTKLIFRAIPGVLVQEVLVTNPTANSVIFNVERVGVDRWEGAKTSTRT